MAEGIAMQRFAESSKSEEERICYDPYAVHFINPKIIEYGIETSQRSKSKSRTYGKTVPGFEQFNYGPSQIF